MKVINFLILLIFFGSFSFGVFAQEEQEAVDTVLDYYEEQAPEVIEQPQLEEGAIPTQDLAQARDDAIIIDSLELKDMDILDVLKLVSKKSGLNIATGKNVHGKVTIFLKNVDVWDALKIILEANDLAYAQEGDIIKVMTAKEYELIYGKKFTDKTQVKIIPLKYASAGDLIPLLSQIKSVIGKVVADEKSNTIVVIDAPINLEDMQKLIEHVDIPTITEVFNLKYAKAEDLQKNISGVMTKNVGRIDIDNRTNKIVVTDTAANMEKVSRMISAFDEKTLQVTIEAKILQVDLSDRFQMGIDWDKVFGGDISWATDFAVERSGYGSAITLGGLSENSYEALIEVLQTMGETNTLSTPRITVLNNQEAKILVGTKEVYVSTTTTTSESLATTAEQVTFVDVGVTLSVTPTINPDGFVTMKIKPEVSSTGTPYMTASGNEIPVVSTSEAETIVMVKDGSTIIIGGLIKDRVSDTVRKIPFLGDIPLLGLLFRSKDKTTTKIELAIFLTPRIVSGDTDYYRPYSREDSAFHDELGSYR
ncbi:MAG: secretin N-terminal domain-containing protein [Candidatus Omnitrophota bacterium]